MKALHLVRPNLYRSGAPSIRDLINLKNKFKIKKIISLDEKIGYNIDPFCKKLNIEHIIINIEPLDINSLKNLFRYNIHTLIDSDTPTLVHCRRGKDRTGLFVALVRCLLDKWNSKDALKEARYLGFGTGLEPHIEKFYTKIINCVDNKKDQNNAYDIVSNMQDNNNQFRDYTFDPLDRFWGPYADKSQRYYPYSSVDLREYDEQYENRENYGLKGIKEKGKNYHIPMVGVYDQNTQITNVVGPSLVGGGFV